jgi:hypothetical protein
MTSSDTKTCILLTKLKTCSPEIAEEIKKKEEIEKN